MIYFNNGRELCNTVIQEDEEKKAIALINKMIEQSKPDQRGIQLIQRFVDEYEKLLRCRALTEGAMLTGNILPDIS